MVKYNKVYSFYYWEEWLLKKRYISSVFLLSACLLTGCASGIELTDEENNMVAEYMAGALLKYDHGYDQALIEAKEDSSERDASTDEKKNTSVIDDTKDSSNIDEDKNTDATNSDTQNTEKKDTTEKDTDKNYTLTDLFEKKQYSLSYKDSMLCSSYPEKNNGYFIVEAAPGQKLVVVRLSVKNLSGKTKKIDLSNEQISYSLNINEKVYDKPLLTAIMNDVQYFSDTIKSGKSKNTVLVFEVDKKTQLSDGSLSITVGKKTANVKLK